MQAAEASVIDPKVKRFVFDTDPQIAARANLGLLVLATDVTIEEELRFLTAFPGVTIYHSRLPCDVTVTPQMLLKMKEELPEAASLLRPHLNLKALGYGCTSASTLIGETEVAEILNGAHNGVPSTNPLTAAKAALTTLGAKNIALLTPYRPDVTLAMQQKFVESGINIVEVGSFYEESDAVVGSIDEQSILEATISLGRNPTVDGVFISCTSLRAAKIIAEAEKSLGKPVTASNHALAWHMLRLAGINDVRHDVGRLYELPNHA